ncbi:MAG TPA: GAF domain-containing SpoIIE family protein phosphatase [Acidimicrobiales bacterium]|nr:GAF domain-containing SpoIIE family protein phosphatase [Acidimicrobiales bacterium]
MPDPAPTRDAADSPLAEALTGLALASTSLRPDDIAAAVARHVCRLGFTDLRIYLADLEQRVLVHLPASGEPASEPLAVDGTVAGRAYRTERPVVSRGERGDNGSEGGSEGEGVLVWLPLLDSAERLGVLAFRTRDEIDDDLLTTAQAVTNLVGEIVANKSDYGDTIVRTRRIQEVSLPAEMRWAMLPPLTYTAGNIAISGIVEPAYEVAGDTFDYAVNGEQAHVAIIDAIGHGLEASRIANLAVLAYRHSRRRDLDSVETYLEMDRVIADQFGSEKFATAQLASLDLSSGQLCWINAGHPPPMVIRQGHRVDLPHEVFLPIGLSAVDPTAVPQMTEAFLEPGDLVLFFTDGVVEARSPDGEQFGRERLGDLMERAAAAAQKPAETMRLLGHAVLDHQNGMLQDDATLLLLAWQGPSRAVPA